MDSADGHYCIPKSRVLSTNVWCEIESTCYQSINASMTPVSAVSVWGTP